MSATQTSVEGWDCHVHVFDARASVRSGHYLPAHRPLHEIESTAQAHGIGHLVLVQPSVYGTDNTVLLHALESAAGRHRGVVVVEPGISDDQLDRLHSAGVRGVRFNLVSPAGNSGDAGDVAADLLRLAPRLRERGWHVQWYVHADALAHLVRWQAETGLPFVLDHLAGLDASLGPAHPAWEFAESLAKGGAWIKLSGWYRLGAEAPYSDLLPNIQRAAQMFGPRMVWGSDWPHTSFDRSCLPAYESTLLPTRSALSETQLQALLHSQAGLLYR